MIPVLAQLRDDSTRTKAVSDTALLVAMIRVVPAVNAITRPLLVTAAAVVLVLDQETIGPSETGWPLRCVSTAVKAKVSPGSRTALSGEILS